MGMGPHGTQRNRTGVGDPRPEFTLVDDVKLRLLARYKREAVPVIAVIENYVRCIPWLRGYVLESFNLRLKETILDSKFGEKVTNEKSLAVALASACEEKARGLHQSETDLLEGSVEERTISDGLWGLSRNLRQAAWRLGCEEPEMRALQEVELPENFDLKVIHYGVNPSEARPAFVEIGGDTLPRLLLAARKAGFVDELSATLSFSTNIGEGDPPAWMLGVDLTHETQPQWFAQLTLETSEEKEDGLAVHLEVSAVLPEGDGIESLREAAATLLAMERVYETLSRHPVIAKAWSTEIVHGAEPLVLFSIEAERELGPEELDRDESQDGIALIGEYLSIVSDSISNRTLPRTLSQATEVPGELTMPPLPKQQ